MASKPASLVPVGIFVSLYLAVAALLAIVNRNWEFIVYIIVVLIVGAVIYYLHKKVGFSKGVLWSLAAWGVLHMVGGLVHVPEGWPINGEHDVFYSWWIIPGFLKYDMVVHAFGFGIATWATWESIGGLLIRRFPTAGVLTVCILAGMGLGAVNEIVEFFTTLLVPGTNVGGYVNTGWDLVANFTGCFVAAACIWLNRGTENVPLPA